MIPGMLKASDLDELKEVIESEKALLMIERDVYWPKWDSPWWYMLLLDETSRLAEIPVPVFKELLTCACGSIYIRHAARYPELIFVLHEVGNYPHHADVIISHIAFSVLIVKPHCFCEVCGRPFGKCAYDRVAVGLSGSCRQLNWCC